ncbi:MAG: flippase-like domain-containing protein [Candidatus Bathyarchaeota archaeon]|nr:MAG: flippase-like domain-containing protein [Candidatus Bathyarchaeota archaeon]
MAKFSQVKIVMQLIVGVAILLWLLQLANLSEVFTSILQFNPINLIGAVAFFLAASTFVGLALCITLRRSNPDAPLRQILMASFAGQLLSDVTPVRSGYFLTPVFLNQLASIPVEKGMTGVLATGGINSFVKVIVCLIGLGYFTSHLPLPPEITISLLVGVVVLLVAGIIFMLIMWNKRFSNLVVKFERMPLIGKKLTKLTEMFANVQSEGQKIRYSLIFVAALILLSILANGTALYFIFHGLWYPSLHLIDFFFIAAFASVLTYIPITIAGLGVQEAGYVLLLHILHGLPISPVNSSFVAFALITRALFTGTDIIGIGPLLKVGLKQDSEIMFEVKETRVPSNCRISNQK